MVRRDMAKGGIQPAIKQVLSVQEKIPSEQTDRHYLLGLGEHGNERVKRTGRKKNFYRLGIFVVVCIVLIIGSGVMYLAEKFTKQDKELTVK